MRYLYNIHIIHGRDISRVGHHNDCFLASDTDFGTYPVGAEEQWKTYIASDTQFTPMGGETCAVYAARTNCLPAMAEMERLHFSYLNRDYNADVINGWSSQGCLNQIRKEMGYRFSLLNAQISTDVAVGGNFKYSVTLENLGWASLFNPRPVMLVIRGSGGSHTVALTDVDPRKWSAGNEHTISGNFNLPSWLPSGEYNLYLTLPDDSSNITGDSRYAIQFANVGTWDS